MPSVRQQRVNEELRKLVGDFIATHANRKAMITPTRVDISPDLKNATVYVSVFPEQFEEEAIHFLRRQGSEVKAFAKARGYFKRIPFFSFEIDYGEKNRQVVQELGLEQDDDEDFEDDQA